MTSGSGTLTADSTVNVSCVNNTYTLSVAMSGLGASKTAVIHESVGSDSDLSFTTNTTQAFATVREHGSTYTVTVATQPAGQTCTLSSGSGTLTANATVNVSCGAPSTLDFGAFGAPPATDMFALGGDLSSAESQTSSAASSMSLTLSSGRSYGFSLYQDRSLLALTSCESEDDHEFVTVIDDILMIDIPGSSTDKTDTLTCSSSGGSLTIDLTISKSPLWHVSSAPTLLRSPPAKIYLGGFSKDGKSLRFPHAASVPRLLPSIRQEPRKLAKS